MFLKEINVALIGYKFMGKAHSHAYKDVSMFFNLPAKLVMKVICGRDEDGVKEAQEAYGWESYETDWRRLIERDDIQLIDMSGSNYLHKDAIMAAIDSGKHVFCEKPLAQTLEDGREMLAAARKAGVVHMVNFNYRKCPAIALAKQMIDEGRIGRVFHVRGCFLQDWIIDPEFPLVWRLTEDGAGSLGDLGAHVIDAAHYLVGGIDQVVSDQVTFIKERPILGKTTGGLTAAKGEGRGRVNVDDATVFIAKFENGALGTIEASRFAAGHKNYNCIEINGSEGSIGFNFERMNELEYFSRNDDPHVQGFRTIQATEPIHPFMQAWWPPGHIIGYEHALVHQVKDIIEGIVEGHEVQPNFEDGVRVQAVLDAVIKSNEDRTWVKVEY